VRTVLGSIERLDGAERTVTYWVSDGQRHYVEVAEERRELDGWGLKKRIVVQLSEVFVLRDAIDLACRKATEVPR